MSDDERLVREAIAAYDAEREIQLEKLQTLIQQRAICSPEELADAMLNAAGEESGHR